MHPSNRGMTRPITIHHAPITRPPKVPQLTVLMYFSCLPFHGLHRPLIG